MRDALTRAFDIADLRRLAQRRLPRGVFEFVDGGALDERTLRANRDDFARWAFVPEVLGDITARDLSTKLFGRRVALPLVLAPTGLAGLLWRRGELAAARAAAAAAGVPYCLSTMAACTIEEIAAEAPDGLRWFQLYVLRDRGLTRSMIDRARASGCDALVLTVDTKMQGPRLRDLRNGFTVPPRFGPATLIDFARHWRWLLDVGLGPKVTFRNFDGSGVANDDVVTIAQFVAGQYDLSVSWRDLEWFKDTWGGPVAVKGILAPRDAVRAVDHGADAVIVSNHGGRQLDGAVSAIRALPAVVDALAGRVPVLLDGGVRRGADIATALALGATACMVGRAWLYGLAAGGERGVARAIALLRDEFDTTLALLGRPVATQLARDVLVDASWPGDGRGG
jgi:isopentenyl diphosphate isomerase/L-lactate dehydrogenase-like FMN-dependent dehydrogenase